MGDTRGDPRPNVWNILKHADCLLVRITSVPNEKLYTYRSMVGLTNQLSAFKLYVMLFLWLVNGFWLWTAPRLQCWHFETKGVLNMCENTHSFFLFAYFFGSVIGSGEGLGRKPSEFTSRRHGPRKGQSSATSALWALVAVGWLQIDLAQRTHPRPRTPTPKSEKGPV